MKISKMIFQLIVAIVLVQGALSSAQKSKCCAPDEFVCNSGFTEGYSSDSGNGGISGYQRTWYVREVGRAAVNQTVTVNGKTSHSFMLLDYTNHKQYVVIGDSCNVQDLNTPPDRCIPDDATYVGPAYLGLKGEGLLVENYHYIVNDVGTSLAATRDGKECLPVGGVASGTQNGVSFLLTYGSTDYILKVEDRSILDIPKVCNQRILKFQSKRALKQHLNLLKITPFL